MIHRNVMTVSLLCIGLLGGAFGHTQSTQGQDIQEQPDHAEGPIAAPAATGQSGTEGRSRDKGRSERGGGPDRSDGGSKSNSGEERRGPPSSRRDTTPGNTGNQPGGKNSKAKVRVGRVGSRVNLPPAVLPAQYAVHDTNKDGQIGMYEWSRNDLSTFNRLDTNHDGFLVPAELVAPGSTASVASTTVAPGSTASFSKSAGGATTPAGTSSPATPSGPPADLKTVAAASAFDFLDKDKDGALSAEELERSRNARKLFSDAKLEIQYPFSKQKFVENYVKLSN